MEYTLIVARRGSPLLFRGWGVATEPASGIGTGDRASLGVFMGFPVCSWLYT